MINADSIKAKLRNLAVQKNKPYDYILMHYFIERLLYRLSISTYSDKFILKGGLLLYTIFGNDARATRDIDFLAKTINNSTEEMVKIFTDICKIKSDDAVYYDLSTISAERIKEDAEYEGIRIKLIGYLDKTRQPMQLDIGYGDIIVPDALDIKYPSLLNMSSPCLRGYSNESVIAEKFEAMLTLAEVNSRMKDFYDVYIYSLSYDFDGGILSEAIYQTLNHRNTILHKEPILFSVEFSQSKEKEIQWKAFQNRIQIEHPISFESVMLNIKNFLSPVYQSIIIGNKFSGTWNKDSCKWVKSIS